MRGFLSFVGQFYFRDHKSAIFTIRNCLDGQVCFRDKGGYVVSRSSMQYKSVAVLVLNIHSPHLKNPQMT